MKIGALLLIILGLIVIAVPVLGILPVAILTGFLVLVLGLGLLLGGISEISESLGLGLIEVILGIIALILGIGFIVNPALFAAVAGFLIYIIGLFLIIVGIIGVITKADNSRWNGVVAIIIGLLLVFIGNNPIYLGVLIGLWLLITGIMMLFQND